MQTLGTDTDWSGILGADGPPRAGPVREPVRPLETGRGALADRTLEPSCALRTDEVTLTLQLRFEPPSGWRRGFGGYGGVVVKASFPTSRSVTSKARRDSNTLLHLGGEEEGLLDLSGHRDGDSSSLSCISGKGVSSFIAHHHPLRGVASVKLEPSRVRLAREHMHWPGSALESASDVEP